MKASKQQGFSLVELMVSITIGLILMAGVLSIFFSSKVTYLDQREDRAPPGKRPRRARPRDARHPFRRLPGLRARGAVHLDAEQFGQLLWNYTFSDAGFRIRRRRRLFAGAGHRSIRRRWQTATSSWCAPRCATATRLRMETSMALLTSPIKVLNAVPAPSSPGTVMMISDCNAASVFQVTSCTPGAPNGTIAHAIGGGNPGNARTISVTSTRPARVRAAADNHLLRRERSGDR